MSEVMNPKQLGDEFGISNVTVQSWLDEAGVQPMHSLPYGRGIMRLYEPGLARSTIEARLPKKQVLGPVPPVVQDRDDQIAALTESVEALKAQNRALYKLIADGLTPKVDRLLAAWGTAA